MFLYKVKLRKALTEMQGILNNPGPDTDLNHDQLTLLRDTYFEINEIVMLAYRWLTRYQTAVAINQYIMVSRLLLFIIAFDENMKFLYLVIQNMSGKFTNFIIFFIVLIYCFVVFSHVQFGTQITSYNNYTNAFLYNLGMMLGSHHELEKMLEYSVFLSSCYIFIFTFILAFIITNMFQIFVKNEYKRLAFQKKQLEENKALGNVFEYTPHFYIVIEEKSIEVFFSFCGFLGRKLGNCCWGKKLKEWTKSQEQERKETLKGFKKEQNRYKERNFNQNIWESQMASFQEVKGDIYRIEEDIRQKQQKMVGQFLGNVQNCVIHVIFIFIIITLVNSHQRPKHSFKFSDAIQNEIKNPTYNSSETGLLKTFDDIFSLEDMQDWLLRVLPKISKYSELASGYVFNDFNLLVNKNYRLTLKRAWLKNVSHPYDWIRQTYKPENPDYHTFNVTGRYSSKHYPYYKNTGFRYQGGYIVFA